MKILALDSSAVSASACILEDGNILAEDYVNIRQTHSQTLMVMVQHVLEITGTCLSDVDVLAVSAATIDPGRVGGNLESAHAILAGLDPAHEIGFAMAMGKLMMKDKQLLVKGAFEEVPIA